MKARAKNGLINWLTIHGMIRTCVDLEKVNWPRVAKFNLPWDFDQVPNIGKKTAKEIEIYLATKGIFPQAKFCEWCGRKFSDLPAEYRIFVFPKQFYASDEERNEAIARAKKYHAA